MRKAKEEALHQNSEDRSSLRFQFYRFFFRNIFRFFGRVIVGKERWQETKKLYAKTSSIPAPYEGEVRIWFHAASVGELESLWPLVEKASLTPHLRLILSVFSTSAWKHLYKMTRKLEGDPPLYVGYSPLEGGWKEVLRATSPRLFVTAKYEAWPEVWHEVARLKIPLALIGAKPRSSILWAKRILKILGGKIPKMIFFSFDPENEAGLANFFPGAEIHHDADPRWDRVFQRSGHVNSRVSELYKEFSSLPRPWGAIGSAWSGDIRALPEMASGVISGTLWVIPHRIDPRSVTEVEILLRELGYTPIRTSAPENFLRPAGKIVVLVDEMGFLVELYSSMDWAFVGGGFATGIHSTIEPAVYGLPIYGGPKGQLKFDEIIGLKKQSQLHLHGDSISNGPANRTHHDFLDWFKHECDRPEVERKQRRAEWIRMNLKNRGASERIWRLLLRALAS